MPSRSISIAPKSAKLNSRSDQFPESHSGVMDTYLTLALKCRLTFTTEVPLCRRTPAWARESHIFWGVSCSLDVVLRNQNNHDYEAQRHSVNAFEPGADIWLLVLRAWYEAYGRDWVRLATIPGGQRSALLLSHEVDWGKLILLRASTLLVLRESETRGRQYLLYPDQICRRRQQ